MTLKHFLLQFTFFIFIFIFSSCTLSGDFDDDVFQVEEEEYMESQGSRVALEGDEDEDYVESDIANDVASDVESTILTNNEFDVIGEDVSVDESIVSDSVDNLVSLETPKKKTWVPLKKIPNQPWRQDGKWVNAVYMARENEDLNQISIKIYGHTNLIDELKNFNPFLKRREPKVGDKIYYNSPNRPNDRVKFSHYYEDNNQTAMTYDIQAGENIRTIAANLLGHTDSWKEIWATNPQVESKGNISEAVTIYYWPGSSATVGDITPPPVPVEEPSVEDNIPPSEPEETLMGDVLEEPPTLNGGAEDVVAMPEEEEALLSPPPKPPSSSDVIDASGGEDSPFVSKNMNMVKIIAIVGILLILAVFFIRIIRNRKNRADFDFSQTHIDIDNIEE